MNAAARTLHDTAPPQPGPASPQATVPPAAATLPQLMDLDFIERNQIVERYLSGKLPPRGVCDFERFCRDNPELLDVIGLPERINAGLRLLEAGGKPEPWSERPKRFWERPQLFFGLLAASVLLLVVVTALAASRSERGERIAALQEQLVAQPLLPISRRRTVKVIPSRTGPSQRAALYVSGGEAQLIDLKIDVSWSKFKAFRVTIDRLQQGRVAVIHNLLRDSNGDLRIAFNSSALGPGNYAFEVEGLTWRGEPVEQAWMTISVQR